MEAHEVGERDCMSTIACHYQDVVAKSGLWFEHLALC